MPQSQIAGLQSRIVSTFPNVSVIDLSATLARFAEIMGRLAGTVRFFGLFSILAGLLIIISSVFATRLARVREAVYFKILGARQGFVLRVFTLENLLMGTICAVLALGLAHLGSWLICINLLEIKTYHSYPGAGAALILANSGWMIFVGLMASRPILRKKPVEFLREQSNG